MSTIIQTTTTEPSAPNLIAIFAAASHQYETLTRQDLETHPFAIALESCDSPESVLNVLRKQAQIFDRFREGDDKLTAFLTPIVNILFTFSATLGEGVGLPFSPAKTIFTGIGVLLGAVNDVISSYQILANMFERIQLFLQRLNHYTTVQPTPAMTELLGNIFAEVLVILALSTKAMKERRIKRFLKRLIGKTEVEDAFARLDMLTKEECLMTAARILEMAHHVDHNMTAVREVVDGVDGNVIAIKEAVGDVGDVVNATKEATLHLHESVTTTTQLTHDVREDVTVLKEDTQAVDRNVKIIKNAIDSQQRDQLREKLRTWLTPPNPSINHHTACDTHHSGTAKWFIEGNTFHQWKNSGSLLWIRGNPGSGKTIISSSIIEHIKNMRESNSFLVAYYYFDFKDAAKRDLRGLLTSLLIQLCDGTDSCWHISSRFYAKFKDGSEYPTDAALIRCLTNMLDLPGQLPVYIVIDALDESPNNTGTPSAREKVLNFLEDLVLSNLSNLFICITSRPEQDIQAILNPLTSLSCRVSLHEEDGQKEDIDSYVRFFVQNDKSMRRWRAEDKKLVISMLLERVGGMFRWAYCQLDTLRRCMPSSILKALNELPITLDDTYERILQGIPREKQRHAHRLFQCMVAAIRPLRVEELGEVFAITFDPREAPNLMKGWRPEDPEDALLSACSTLISVIDDKDSKIVQFSHFSVKEFLTSDRLQRSEVGGIRDFHIPLEPAHTTLARACITVLLQLDEKVDKNELATFPLVFYAAEYWVDHAKFENVASQFQDAMEDLFNPRMPHFRAWIWTHNVEWGARSMDTLSEKPSLPDVTPLYFAALCGFSELAEHLIITHGEDVNAYSRNSRWATPLGAALYRGHVDAALVLLDHGADTNGTTLGSRSPLSAAYHGNHVKGMQLLLEHGANVEDRRYFALGTALHDASFRGNVEIVDLLLRHKADANARGVNKQVPLGIASIEGHLEIARLLLKNGADVNAVDPGYTALSAAAFEGHLDVVQLLVDNGADVRPQSGGNALQLATTKGYHEIAQLLLEHCSKRDEPL